MIIYTIRQAASYLRQILEADEVLADLWVEGEVSNLSRPSSGHVYFTLKDDSAQLRCVLFRGQNQGFQLENGAQVIAHGRVSIYEAWGQLQLYVDFVRPQGMGLLHLQLERLKEKLRAEGLFEESRKRPLPAFPRRIGLVTSPTRALLHHLPTPHAPPAALPPAHRPRPLAHRRRPPRHPHRPGPPLAPGGTGAIADAGAGGGGGPPDRCRPVPPLLPLYSTRVRPGPHHHSSGWRLPGGAMALQ